jgi:large subunit ribosomal protein L28
MPSDGVILPVGSVPFCRIRWAMAKRCQLTGVGPMFGHKVSHANNRSNRKFLPNLQWKRVWVPELGRWVRLKLTAKALKTLDRKGYAAMLRELGVKMK